jgi:hypothetical protein
MYADKDGKGVESYSKDDRELLISLLNEYSEKLSSVCTRIEKYGVQSDALRQKSWNIFSVILMLIGVGISFSNLLQTVIREDVVSNNFQIPRVAIVSVYSFSLFVLLMAFRFVFLFESRRRNISRSRASLVREGRLLFGKLERVVQIVSQMQEHSVISLSSRVELDLRLFDTEQVLMHYKELTRGEPNSERFDLFW